MDNEIYAHIFGRSKRGDREEAKLLLFNKDGTPFTPGSGGAAEVVQPLSGLWLPMWSYMGGATASVNAKYPPVTRAVLQADTVSAALYQGTPIAGAKSRIVAYADTPEGPGAKVLESADIDHGTTGVKTVPFALPPGPIWIANWLTAGSYHANVTGANTMNPNLPGFTPPAGTMFNAWVGNDVGLVPQDPFPSGPKLMKGQAVMPAIYFQVA